LEEAGWTESGAMGKNYWFTNFVRPGLIEPLTPQSRSDLKMLRLPEWPFMVVFRVARSEPTAPWWNGLPGPEVETPG